MRRIVIAITICLGLLVCGSLAADYRRPGSAVSSATVRAPAGTLPEGNGAGQPAEQAQTKLASDYTLEFGTITSGGGAYPDGSFVSLGQPLVGAISNAQYTIELGAVPIIQHLSNCDRNGDASGDCVVGLPDIESLPDCLQGPGAASSDDCKAFDFDSDGDVDFADFAAFQRAVNAR